MKGKTADLEKLVENKLRVNVYMNKMKEMRNSAELGSADYENAEVAMNKLKPIQKVVRITRSVEESNAKLAEAKAIADGVKKTPIEVEASVTEVPVDSNATNG